MISLLLVFAFILWTNIAIPSINILILTAMIIIAVYKFPKLFKSALLWYLISLILGLVAAYFYESYWVIYITRGYVSLAIFYVVMFTGVTPKKWPLTQTLVRVRGTFSIIGFLLITPHALLHLFEVLDGVDLFGIATYALMIPLTIISFQVIRREIQPKDWLNIQKVSYIIYIILFIHVLIVSSWQDKVVYITILTLYVNNKLYKEFYK